MKNLGGKIVIGLSVVASICVLSLPIARPLPTNALIEAVGMSIVMFAVGYIMTTGTRDLESTDPDTLWYTKAVGIVAMCLPTMFLLKCIGTLIPL